MQLPVSVVCVALEPCPLVVVHVPVEKVLPCAGLTANAGDANTGTEAQAITAAIANFFLIGVPFDSLEQCAVIRA